MVSRNDLNARISIRPREPETLAEKLDELAAAFKDDLGSQWHGKSVVKEFRANPSGENKGGSSGSRGRGDARNGKGSEVGEEKKRPTWGAGK